MCGERVYGKWEKAVKFECIVGKSGKEWLFTLEFDAGVRALRKRLSIKPKNYTKK